MTILRGRSSAVAAIAKFMKLTLMGLLCVVLACGDDDVATDAATDSGTDAAADSSADDAATDSGPDANVSDAGSDSGADSGSDAAIDTAVDALSGCATEITALQSELYESTWTCSVVVRLDHNTLTMLGHQVFCATYTSVDETGARATAATDTGYGGGSMLNPASPEDTFVFYESPGDFGGASAVNARNGRSVFGGSIIWSGTGEIVHPTEWRSPGELGSGCPIVGADISSRGYDLVSGAALPTDDVDAAVAVVRDTAVPGAFWGGGYLFDAVVLRYPRSVGVFNPDTAEWIVIVNGGWLE